jgi:hypothetical protein
LLLGSIRLFELVLLVLQVLLLDHHHLQYPYLHHCLTVELDTRSHSNVYVIQGLRHHNYHYRNLDNVKPVVLLVGLVDTAAVVVVHM